MKDLFDYKNRVIGLDLIRVLAIFYVFWGHGALLVPSELKDIYNYFIILPLEGVTTFFVLSGFLIGNILLKTIEKPDFKLNDVFVFWKRRWLRTLPAYFFILIILVVFKFDKWNFDFRFLLFFQNFTTNTPDFFHVAWSLSIEEWFYFSIPIFIFVLSLFLSKKKSILLTVLFFLIIPVILRYVYLNKCIDCDLEIRKITPFRFDSMMYGIILAIIQQWFHKIWNILEKNGFYVFGFLILIYFYAYNFFNTNTDEIFILNFESILIFFLLPSLFKIKKFRSAFFNKLIVFNSKISYSLYLIHGNIVLWWWLNDTKLNDFFNSLFRFELQRLILFVLYFLLSFSLSILSYKFIEKPFLKWREKRIKE